VFPERYQLNLYIFFYICYVEESNKKCSGSGTGSTQPREYN
jgi:hypothetical protein